MRKVLEIYFKIPEKENYKQLDNNRPIFALFYLAILFTEYLKGY